ncbi:uncharacterized protein G2W53_011720 [Senna tora]|uniref:Uncharacterized protein n=1 Tax=Senna tora TaxID=362788 RepID=A0A835CB23_9FABA|nr:uncharacterized protein G2W53_011720 [Senna tora]
MALKMNPGKAQEDKLPFYNCYMEMEWTTLATSSTTN